MSEKPKSLAERLHAVMASLPAVSKEKKRGVPFDVVSHDAVMAAMRPLLIDHGIVALCSVRDFKECLGGLAVTVDVTFTNKDQPEDSLTVTSLGIGQGKDIDKAPGKAISYAVKYAFLKCFMIETGEQDEVDYHHGSNQPRPRSGGTTQKPAQPTPNHPGRAEMIHRGFNRLKKMATARETPIEEVLAWLSDTVHMDIKTKAGLEGRTDKELELIWDAIAGPYEKICKKKENA